MVPDENITLRQFQALSSRFVQLDHLYVRLPNGQVVSMAEDRKYMLNAIDIDFNDQDTKYYADENTITLTVEDIPVEEQEPRGPTTKNIFSVYNIWSRLSGGDGITIPEPTQAASGVTTIKVKYDPTTLKINNSSQLAVNNIFSRLNSDKSITLTQMTGSNTGITKISVNHNNTLSTIADGLSVWDISPRLSQNNGIILSSLDNGITQIGIKHDETLIDDGTTISVYNIKNRLSAGNNGISITSTAQGITKITPQFTGNGGIALSSDKKTFYLSSSYLTGGQNNTNTYQFTIDDKTIKSNLINVSQLANDAGYIAKDSFLSEADYVKGSYNAATHQFTPAPAGEEDDASRYLKLTFSVKNIDGVISGEDTYLDVTELFQGYKEGFGIQLSSNHIILTGTILQDGNHIHIDENNKINATYIPGRLIAIDSDGTIRFTGQDGSEVSSVLYDNGFGLALSTIDEYHKQFYLTGTVLSGGNHIEVTQDNYINSLLSGGTHINVNNDHSINFALSAGKHINFNNGGINNGLQDGTKIHIGDDGTINYTGQDGADVPRYTAGFGLALSSNEFRLTGTVLSGGRFIQITPDHIVNDYITLSAGRNTAISSMYQTVDTGEVDDEDQPITKEVQIGYFIENLLSSGTHIKVDDINHSVNFGLSAGKWINFNNGGINNGLKNGTNITIADDGSINCNITPGEFVTPISAGRYIEIDTTNNNTIHNVMQLFSGTNIEVNKHLVDTDQIEDDSDPENIIYKKKDLGYQIHNLLSGGRLTTVDNNTHLINNNLSGVGYIFINDVQNKISTNLHQGTNITIDENGAINCNITPSEFTTDISSGRFIIISGTNNSINCILSGQYPIYTDEDTALIGITDAGSSVIKVLKSVSGTVDWYNENSYTAGTNIQITSTNVINCLLSGDGKHVFVDNDTHKISTNFQQGTNISIEDNGTINCTLTPSEFTTDISSGRFIIISGNNNSINCTLSGLYPIYTDEENDLIGISGAGSSVVKILKSVSGDIKWEDETILTSGRFIEISGDNYSINCTLTGLDQLQNTPGYITSTSIPGATPITSGRFIEVTGALNSINNTMEMFDGVNTSALLHYKTIIDDSDPENPIQKQVEDGYQIDCLLSGDETHVFIDNITHTISTNFHGSSNIIVSNDGTISCTLRGWDGNDDNTQYTSGRFIEIGSAMVDGKWPINSILSGEYPIYIDEDSNLVKITPAGSSVIKVLKSVSGVISWQDNTTNLSGGRYININENNGIDNLLSGDEKTIKITSAGVIYIPSGTVGQLLSTTANGTEWVDNPGYITNADLPCGTVYATDFGLASKGASNNIFYLTGTVLSGGRYINIGEDHIVDNTMLLSSGTNIAISTLYTTTDQILDDSDPQNIVYKQVEAGYIISNLLSGGEYIDVNNTDHTINFTLSNGQWINFNDGKINSFLQDGTHIHIDEDGKINFTGNKGGDFDTTYSDGRFITISGDNNSINCILSGNETTLTITSGAIIDFIAADSGVVKVLKSVSGEVGWYTENSYIDGDHIQITSTNVINCLLSGDGNITYIDGEYIKIKPAGNSVDKVLRSVNGVVQWGEDERGIDGSNYYSGRFNDIGTGNKINSTLSGKYPIYIDEDEALIGISGAESSVIKVLKSVSGNVVWETLSTFTYSDSGISSLLFSEPDENNNITIQVNPEWLSGSTTDQTGYYSITGAILKYLKSLNHDNDFNTLKIDGDTISWQKDNTGTGGDGWYRYIDTSSSLIFETNNSEQSNEVHVNSGWLNEQISSFLSSQHGFSSGNIFRVTSGGDGFEWTGFPQTLTSGRFIEITSANAINCLLSGDETTIHIFEDTGIISCLVSSTPPIEYQPGNQISIDPDTHTISWIDPGDGDTLYYADGETISGYTEDNKNYFKVWDIYSRLSAGYGIGLDHDTDTGITTISSTISGYLTSNDLFEGKNIAISTHYKTVDGEQIPNGLEIVNLLSGGRYTEVNNDTHAINSTLSGDTDNLIDIVDNKIKIIKGQQGYVLYSTADGIKWDEPPSGDAPITNNYYTSTYLNGYGLGLSTDTSNNNYFFLTGTILNGGRHTEITSTNLINCLLSGSQYILIDENSHIISTNLHGDNKTIWISNDGTISCSLPSGAPGKDGQDGAPGRDGTLLSGRVNIDVTEDGYIDCLLSGEYPIYINNDTHLISISGAGDNVVKVLKSVSGNIDWYNQNSYTSGTNIQITSTNIINCLLSGSDYIKVNNDTHIISTNLHGDETTIHVDPENGTISCKLTESTWSGDEKIDVDNTNHIISWKGGNLGNTYYEGPGIDIYTSDGKDYISTLISGGPNVTVWYENNYAVISSYVPSTNTYSEGFGIDIQQDPTTIEGQETLAYPNNYIISTTLVGDNKHIKVTEDEVISSLLKGDDSITEIDNNIIKIKPYTNNTVNYVLRSNKGVVQWGEDESGGDTWNVTCTTIISGLGFPRYNVLYDDQVSMPLTSLAQGQSFLIPVQSGIPVKWYTPSGYVTARYAPDTNTEDGEVVNLTSYLSKGMPFTPSANGYIRLSVFDDGSYPGDCLRLLFNNNETWEEGYPLYRFKGNDNKINIDNVTLSAVPSTINSVTAYIYQVWDIYSRLSAGPNIKLIQNNQNGITTISAAGGSSTDPGPSTPSISSYIYAAANSTGKSDATSPVTDPYINLVEKNGSNTWVNSYIHLLGAGNVSVSALNGTVTISGSGAASNISTMLYAGTGTTKQNDQVTTNGNVKLKLFDNNTFRTSIGFTGAGGTNVTCNDGTVTISSTNSSGGSSNATLYAGSGTTKENDDVTENGEVRLKLFNGDNNSSNITLQGTGGTKVTSNVYGTVFINSFSLPTPPSDPTCGIVLLGYDCTTSGYFWYPTAPCD